MGQQVNGTDMGQQQVNGTGRCCQQDVALIQSNCVSASDRAQLAQFQEDGYNMIGGMGRDWHCLRAEDGPALEVVGESTDLLESLSYSPVRFDVSTTIDIERSQARYSNLVVHSSRARLQRRSKVWEDWLRAASAGRTITLLSGFPDETPRVHKDGMETPKFTCKRTLARYFLDRALTRISVAPVDKMLTNNPAELDPKAEGIYNIQVDSIQVICTATDFTLFADRVENQLDEAERRRAILLQYLTDDQPAERRRICFLEATASDKDRFVQALTALWLEKRNDHSMCF